ncbi:MAG: hypothetical protein WCL50_00200 [Spirochaetota bacterium]
MRLLARVALMALLAAGAAAAAFAATTVTDTVGTAFSATDGVLMLGIAGEDQAVFTIRRNTDQSVAGARATTVINWEAASDGGYLRYTAHGYTKPLKIMVESPTVGYVPCSISARAFIVNADGSDGSTLGSISGFWYPVLAYAIEFISGISGTDTWTGTDTHSGVFLHYEIYFDPGVSSIDVVYSIMEQ